MRGESNVAVSKTKTAPFSDDRRTEELISLHKGSQKDLGIESRLRLSCEAQRGCNVSIDALTVKENEVEHSEPEDSYGPLGFTHEDAKGGGESIRESDDDSMDEMIEAKKSWFIAKQMDFCLEDEEGMLKALAKSNRKARKESKSKKKRKHERKIAKEA